MTSVLGVDGGQSAIRLRHSAILEPFEVEGVSRGDGDPVEGVAMAVAAAWRQAAFPPVDRVVLGLTTAPVDAADADRLCTMVAADTGAREIVLTDDAVTGHAGALSGCPGISMVVGTGVATLAMPEIGEPRIIGGHGFLLGDEGGGFWIGRAGLSAVLRALDGRGPATALMEAAERRFGRLHDLPVRVHDAARPVNAIAQFAPMVLDAADRNDAGAVEIIDAAAAELLGLARAAASWVGGARVPLALGGKLLAPATALRRRLDALMVDSSLPLVPRMPDGSALDGALLLGRDDVRRRYGGLVHEWRGGPRR